MWPPSVFRVLLCGRVISWEEMSHLLCGDFAAWEAPVNFGQMTLGELQWIYSLHVVVFFIHVH